MATRLYLHEAVNSQSGTLPEDTTQYDDEFISLYGSADAQFAGSLPVRTMTETIGTSQTSKGGSTLAQTTLQRITAVRFVSDPLAAQTILGSGTFVFNCACRVNSLNVGATIREPQGLACYIWRPATGLQVGSALFVTTFNGHAPSVINQEQVSEATSTFFDGTTLNGDVLVFEVTYHLTQTDAVSHTVDVFYDGTTVNRTGNAVVSNHASFLEFSQTLMFQSGGGGGGTGGFKSLLGVGR
jgi:hypothetical protein